MCPFEEPHERHALDTRGTGLQVYLWPGEIQAEAAWRLLDGPETNWHGHGDTIIPLPPGNYTATFRAPAHWHPPGDIIMTVETDLFARTNVFYQPSLGTIYCDLLPAAAATDGALWRIGGPHAPTNWMPSGDGITTKIGVHTLEFHRVTGWLEPNPFPVELTFENEEIRTQAVYTCHYQINPANILLGASAATSSVGVIAGSDCAWTSEILAGASWVEILEGAEGLGTGTVRFAVAENIQPEPREATLLIADLEFQIHQEAYICEYVLEPTGTAFSAEASTGTVTIAAGPACAWTAEVATGTNWVAILGEASGMGTGTVSFAVSPNTRLAPRQALLRIAGEDFLVGQDGNPGAGLPLGGLQLLLLDRNLEPAQRPD